MTKPETKVVEELVEASVLAMFFIQKLGKAHVDEILAKIEATGGAIDEHLLTQAVEALQARGLVSYARGRKKGTGESVKMWKPKQAIWAAPPEVAHITELLPALVSTPEAQDLITRLNADEAEGAGEKKATRKLGYDEYVEVEATFVTMDELLGSQPASPWLDKIVKASPFNGVKADLRFWRDQADGALVIGADAVRGWLRTGMRTEGFADVVATYIGIAPIRIKPKQAMVQIALPVVDMRGGGGKGLNTYEAIQPGQPIVMRFRIPTRGFMTVERFKVWLAGYAPNPIRGISPARGARYGALAMTDFKVIGDLRSARTLLDSVMDQIPAEAQEFYKTMRAEYDDNDLILRKGAK